MGTADRRTAGGGSSSGTETVSDSCFLLTEIEIFGSVDYPYSVAGEGTQYAYYKAGNSKVKNTESYSYHWWKRSPYSGNGNSFCLVDMSGEAVYSDPTFNPLIAFAFCI